MSDESGAFGALATAGLIASTVTPASGHFGDAHGKCANCDTTIGGRFCSNCGQASHVHRSLMHVGEEFLHGLTHFDGKAWQTLPLLLFRPGKLTRDYVYGHRMRYVPPVALFLLTVFLMFFAFSFVKVPNTIIGEPAAATRAERVKQADTARENVAQATKAINDIQAERAKTDNDPNAKPGASGTLAGAQAAAETALEVAKQNAANTAMAVDHPDQAKTEISVNWLEQLKQADAKGEIKPNSSIPGVDKKLHHALQNPELTLYKLQQKAYKYSFLLIPLSLPWLWMMFMFRRDVHLYDHAVFTLYSLSFMSLLLIAAVTVGQLFDGWAGPATFTVMIVVPLHIFLQLKGAYRLGIWGAMWRTWFLLFGALLSLTFFATAIVVLGLVD